MPAKDLEAFLPAVGVHMPTGASLQGGTMTANLQINGPTNKLVTSGTVGLFNAQLTNFDLWSKLAATLTHAIGGAAGAAGSAATGAASNAIGGLLGKVTGGAVGGTLGTCK